MLHNPQWDSKKTDSTIFSLDALIDWLRQQYAEDEYCFLSNGDCLLARYFTDCGYENVSVGEANFVLRDNPDHDPIRYPSVFDNIACGVAFDRKHTFGAALERALAFRAREKIAA